MRYVVYGAGAIGGLIGGVLHAHGIEVLLIARGAHLAKIRERGLEIQWPEPQLQRVPVAGHPSEIRFRADDVAIMCAKLQDTAAALAQLCLHAGPEIPVLCAQNGIDGERQAQRHFRRVYPMWVGLRSMHLEPGVIEFTGQRRPGVLDLGLYPGGADELAHAMVADFKRAGFDSVCDSEIMGRKNRKLMSNLSNSLDAICGPEARHGELARLIKEEGRGCLAAAGLDLGSEQLDLERRAAVGPGAKPPPGRGETSSWQSLARGSGSAETDFLNGEIVLLGKLHGFPTPINTLILTVMWEMIRSGARPGTISEAQLRARLPAGKPQDPNRRPT